MCRLRRVGYCYVKAHIEVFFDNGYEKHQVILEQEVLKRIFSKDELEVMRRVYEKFINYGLVEISNYSYREKGYNATRTGEIISNVYAGDIELN